MESNSASNHIQYLIQFERKALHDGIARDLDLDFRLSRADNAKIGTVFGRIGLVFFDCAIDKHIQRVCGGFFTRQFVFAFSAFEDIVLCPPAELLEHAVAALEADVPVRVRHGAQTFDEIRVIVGGVKLHFPDFRFCASHRRGDLLRKKGLSRSRRSRENQIHFALQQFDIFADRSRRFRIRVRFHKSKFLNRRDELVAQRPFKIFSDVPALLYGKYEIAIFLAVPVFDEKPPELFLRETPEMHHVDVQ